MISNDSHVHTKTLWFQHRILTLSIVICLALVTSFNKSWISTLQTFQRCKFSHMFAKRQELHAVAQPAFQDVVAHHADLREQQTMWPSQGSSGVPPGSDGLHLRMEVNGGNLTVGEPMNETSNATTNPNKTGKGNAYHLAVPLTFWVEESILAWSAPTFRVLSTCTHLKCSASCNLLVVWAFNFEGSCSETLYWIQSISADSCVSMCALWTRQAFSARLNWRSKLKRQMFVQGLPCRNSSLGTVLSRKNMRTTLSNEILPCCL